MILDTSALVAIFFREPERDELLSKIGAADEVGIGAPTLVETAVVLGSSRAEQGVHGLMRILERARVVVISFEREHWLLATDAWLRFGRGRHPARLNFGDCLTYATARLSDQPLLCVGDDFSETDLVLA